MKDDAAIGAKVRKEAASIFRMLKDPVAQSEALHAIFLGMVTWALESGLENGLVLQAPVESNGKHEGTWKLVISRESLAPGINKDTEKRKWTEQEPSLS